jgi:hypothetical protein
MQDTSTIRTLDNFFDLSGMLYNIVGSIYLIEGLWEEAKACHFKIWETGFQGRFCPSMLDIIILLLLLFFLLIRVY